MPCVFPIWSLKALSLARSGSSAYAARVEAFSYTAGAIIVCAGLGALLLVLRAAGGEIGWAFQLQNPYVILSLTALMAIITFRSEEHTSELQSLMRTSYAVFCLKKQKNNKQ